MSETIHALAQSLLGKASVEECTPDEIAELVNRYPYFAPAQFLFLQKLKQENASEYLSQLQKSVLYYHDALAFEYFINSDQFYTEINFHESGEPSVSNHQPEENSGEEVTEEFTDQILPEEKIPEADQQITQSVETVLIQEEKQMNAPVENNALVFEPYHTVDYFASQGIKLSQEEAPKDKFGKQLKSFTEWLKTMKRIPPAEISKTVDTSTESKVQHLAEDSVHDADVVTEAMAEVWAKQGDKDKALKIYEQLSLLNPSKKAYFANQIENLKRS